MRWKWGENDLSCQVLDLSCNREYPPLCICGVEEEYVVHMQLDQTELIASNLTRCPTSQPTSAPSLSAPSKNNKMLNGPIGCSGHLGQAYA